MKRLIAAAILLVFVVSVYMLGYFYTNNACDDARVILNNCVEKYINGNEAKKDAEELKDFWHKKEGILSIFANHEEIDKIELAINSLVVHSDTKDNKMFYEYSSTIKTLLHQLEEISKPTLHSIF